MERTNDLFLSVVIPAYNEVDRIERTLRSVHQYLRTQPYRSEIIVVDDGSADGTRDLLERAVRAGMVTRVLRHRHNLGKGAAVRTGMRAAVGEYRLMMDADNSVSIDHLELFLSRTERGFDVVIGSIAHRSARVTEYNAWHRRFLGKLSKRLIRFVVPKIGDTQRGFKLFSARAAERLFAAQRIAGFGFDIEILALAQRYRYQIAEVPVVWNNPTGSKVTLGSYVAAFGDLLRVAERMVRKDY